MYADKLDRLPVEYLPAWNKKPRWIEMSPSGAAKVLAPPLIERFPHAIADDTACEGVTLREQRMLDFVNGISDKPEWERKVFDEDIIAKW